MPDGSVIRQVQDMVFIEPPAMPDEYLKDLMTRQPAWFVQDPALAPDQCVMMVTTPHRARSIYDDAFDRIFGGRDVHRRPEIANRLAETATQYGERNWDRPRYEATKVDIDRQLRQYQRDAMDCIKFGNPVRYTKG